MQGYVLRLRCEFDFVRCREIQGNSCRTVIAFSHDYSEAMSFGEMAPCLCYAPPTVYKNPGKIRLLNKILKGNYSQLPNETAYMPVLFLPFCVFLVAFPLVPKTIDTGTIQLLFSPKLLVHLGSKMDFNLQLIEHIHCDRYTVFLLHTQ